MLQLDRIIDLISTLNSEGTVGSINDALRDLSEVLHLDRCILRSRLKGSAEFTVISEWCAEGLTPIDVLEPQMNSEASIYLIQQMLLNGEVLVSDVLDSNFTQQEKDRAMSWGCRSFLFIPLRYQNAINGMITAIQSASPRLWSHGDKQAVRLLGETALAVCLHTQSLQALSESKQQYQWALDASSDAVWDWDVNTNTLVFSHRLYIMLGYDPETSEIHLDQFLEHVHSDDYVFLLQAMNSAKSSPLKSRFIEFRIYTVSGSMIWLRSSGRVVARDKKGKPLRVVGTYSDITTFKQTLQQLELARENADRANAAKSEFLARMSHEVRTPLNAIMGMLYLLKDTETSKEQREKLLVMQDSSQLLLSVLNDVLDFSKIESGKLELESIPFVLEDVIRQVFALLLASADAKGLQLGVIFQANVPSLFKGDANRLAQILVNLIANAIKFTEVGQVVLTISVKKRQSEQITLEFSVQDSGIGIADEDIAVLFNSYAQAKKSIAREYGGTGLGLSICKSLVELMGGNIFADSRVGEGSNFCFNVELGVQHKTFTIEDNLVSLINKRVLLLCLHDKMIDIYTQIFVNLGMTLHIYQNDQMTLDAITPLLSQWDYVLIDSTWIEHFSNTHNEWLDQLLSSDKVLVACNTSCECMRKRLKDQSQCQWLLKPITPKQLIKHLLPADEMQVHELAPTEISITEPIYPLLKIKVLLVEDNAVNRLIAVSILKKQGIDVVEAVSALEAINYLSDEKQAHSIDVIIMDIEMPMMSGYEATLRIRQLPIAADIPIVAMTANNLKADIDQCFQHGMNAHLPKPFDPDKLFQTLMQLSQKLIR